MQLSQCHPHCVSSIKPHSTPCFFGFRGNGGPNPPRIVKKECTGCGNEWTAPVLDCPDCGPLQDVFPIELQGELVYTPTVSVTINNASPEQAIAVLETLKGLS